MTLDKGWMKTIEDGLENPIRHVWDPWVRATVTDYNTRLAKTPGYVAVDWKIVRAMLWVESGGPEGSTWWGRVMQIGNAGDLGYAALKKNSKGKREGATEIVVRSELLALIDKADKKALDVTAFNIEVGIAYLFESMSMSDVVSILDTTDTALHEHKVASGEAASTIAQHEGTTPEEMKASNPGMGVLHPGQVLHFHKAHKGRQITGWRVFEPTTIAAQYNGGGDKKYAEKLRYVLDKLKDD